MKKIEIKPSIAGGVVTLTAVVLDMKTGDFLRSEFWRGAVITVTLGVVGGYLIERLIERYKLIRENLEASLAGIKRYSDEMHREIHASTLLLCSIIGIPNSQEPIQKWAMQELLKHFEKIPTENKDVSRAREIYCRYLRKALEAAGATSTWLGIHEDTVSFFTASNHEQERLEYINTLNNYPGKKYRIFVEGEKNREELRAAEIIADYLNTTAGKSVESFCMTREAFNSLVRPHADISISDWALYGEKVLLEFNVNKNLILFHVREDSTRGMRRLLQEVQRPKLERGIGIESIDADYVKKLRT